MSDLSVSRIAEEALALVDEKGADAFSLRAVAQRLGVTPMALYHHVSGKEHLAELVVDAAIGPLSEEQMTGDWREDLWRMAQLTRQHNSKHPEVTQLRRNLKVWTDNMLKVSQVWHGVWRKSDLPADLAAKAASASSLSIFGLLNDQALVRGQQITKKLGSTITKETSALFADDEALDDLFEFTVRAIIHGAYERAKALAVARKTPANIEQ